MPTYAQNKIHIYKWREQDDNKKLYNEINKNWRDNNSVHHNNLRRESYRFKNTNYESECKRFCNINIY